METNQTQPEQTTAVALRSSTAIAAPSDWADDRDKLDLIKRTVAKGTSDDEFELFVEVARTTGLSPIQKQIYAIMRWDGRERREVMSIQTGIDGYRLIAHRTGEHAGTPEIEFGDEDREGNPPWARCTVYRIVYGEPREFVATARWREYVQTKKDGSPMGLWGKMPHTMLGKCAEALALRRAFPAELSGLYTREEMMQAESEGGRPKAQAPRRRALVEVDENRMTPSDVDALAEEVAAALPARLFSADEIGKAVAIARTCKTHDAADALRDKLTERVAQARRDEAKDVEAEPVADEPAEPKPKAKTITPLADASQDKSARLKAIGIEAEDYEHVVRMARTADEDIPNLSGIPSEMFDGIVGGLTRVYNDLGGPARLVDFLRSPFTQPWPKGGKALDDAAAEYLDAMGGDA